MRYIIADLETQTHKKYKRVANPFLEENYIVARGWKVQGDTRAHAEFYDKAQDVPELTIPDDVDTYVAHNAKFELLYEKRFSKQAMHEFFKRGGKIWCTQYAEYLLNAQQQKYHMITLDKASVIYGGRVKTDGVKLLWEAGVQTSEIDRDLLRDYLIGTEEEKRNSGDIGNTELVYLGQVKAAKQLGMYKAIKVRMDGLCATSDMEFRGIKIDVDRARTDLKKRMVEYKEATEELSKYITGLPDGLEFNWNSNTHKSCIIFGGTVKYTKSAGYIDDNGEPARYKAKEAWPLFDGEAVHPNKCVKYTEDGMEYYTYEGEEQDTYKSGKKIGEHKFKQVPVPGELKSKLQPFFYEFPGYTTPDPSWKSALTDGLGGPLYSTSSDTIERISNRGIPFLKTLGTVNRLTKEIGTYYIKVNPKNGEKSGMLTCVQPWNHMIHHKLNHTSTVTTRLSSSDPNLQNVTRADFDAELGLYKSEVKAMFVSRFGDEGRMAELDYSQLEVVCQGLLSMDKNLIRDLNDNVDFHCKRVALKNNVDYAFALHVCKNEQHEDFAKWKKERTRCKIFSFQRAYGGGAALISEETGMDIEEVKSLIEAEDLEYPGVEKFNAKVAKEVNSNYVTFRDGERGYREFKRGTYQSITGTMYSFRSWDSPSFMRSKGILDSFKPTEMKNYPVQGVGGELVQMVLGQLWRWFVKNDFFGGKAFLVNTVHDCVWADCHIDVLDTVVAGMKKIMQAIPHFFGIHCPVKFPVDAETGRNMLELSHWTPKGETHD